MQKRLDISPWEAVKVGPSTSPGQSNSTAIRRAQEMIHGEE